MDHEKKMGIENLPLTMHEAVTMDALVGSL